MASSLTRGRDRSPAPSARAAFRQIAAKHAGSDRLIEIPTELRNAIFDMANRGGQSVPVPTLHTAQLFVARGMYRRMGWQRAPEYAFYPLPENCAEAYIQRVSARIAR